MRCTVRAQHEGMRGCAASRISAHRGAARRPLSRIITRPPCGADFVRNGAQHICAANASEWAAGDTACRCCRSARAVGGALQRTAWVACEAPAGWRVGGGRAPRVGRALARAGASKASLVPAASGRSSSCRTLRRETKALRAILTNSDPALCVAPDQHPQRRSPPTNKCTVG